MKKVLIWLMVAALLVSALPAGAAVAQEEGTVEVILTKVGSAPAEAIEDAQFNANGMVAWVDGRYEILNYQGINALGESYDYVEQFCNGSWLVYQNDKGVNGCGLVKADGTVLISVSAAIIDDVSGPGGLAWENTVRYLEVTYATEEVTDREQAFVFVSENGFAMTPEEGDKLYGGYALYYDLQQQRFVGELKRTSNAELTSSIKEVGDKLFFEKRETIYDENGAEFAAFSGFSIDGFFCNYEEDDRFGVYDCDLQLIASFDRDVSAIYRDGQLFGFDGTGDEPAVVLDIDGARVGELPFRYVPDEYGPFLYGVDGDGNYLVMDFTGKTLIDGEAGVTYADEGTLGYLRLSFADGGEGLLYPDGTVVRGENLDGLLLSEDRGDGAAYLVLKDRALTLELPESTDFEGAPMLVAGMKDGQALLFNVANGEVLLTSDCEYLSDAFFYADGYLYARQGDVYDIYAADFRY